MWGVEKELKEGEQSCWHVALSLDGVCLNCNILL